MRLTAVEMIGAVRDSRARFYKHLVGLKEDQWDWKPYPECKSIRETLAHLIADDRAALQSLRSGEEPDYDACQEGEQDLEKLKKLLAQSHRELIDYLEKRFGDSSLAQEVSIWGVPLKLGIGLAMLTSEDYYHAGQVSYIRLASDPSWDYYGSIYGGS